MKTLFRILVGALAVIGILALSVTSLGVWAVSRKIHEQPKPPEKIVLVMNFNQDMVERADIVPGSLRDVIDTVTSEGQISLHDVVQALERGAHDPRVLGIVGLFGANLPHLAQGQEIRAALEKFRAAGKFSYAFSTGYGGYGSGSSAYYMASAFEQVWLQPVGQLGLMAAHTEQPFVHDALQKIGIEPRMMQREEYKSAMSFLTEDRMTPPVHAMMQSIIDDTNAQLAEGLAQSRHLPVAAVAGMLREGPYTAQEALSRKLIDKIGYLDEIEKKLDDTFGKKTTKMRPDAYVQLPPAIMPSPPRATVALIYATGEIKDGGGPGAPIPGSETMNQDEIVAALDDAAKDKAVKMIVLRVDSPGGSPTASETIRRAVMLAQQRGKKVIVSMGGMAGSGGYWIAMNGDRIFADAATLTGSIGVVGGKFVLAGLFAKLGVNWDVIDSGKYSGMMSFLRESTPEEQARANALIDDTYNTFRANVAAARKIPMEKMPEVSKGRVFTGAQAVKLGLVDQIGGLRATLDYAAKELGADSAAQLKVKLFPEPETVEDWMRANFKRYLHRNAAMPDVAVAMNMLGLWLQQAAHMPPAARMLPIGTP